MKRTNGTKPVAVDIDDLGEKRLSEFDDDDPEESHGHSETTKSTPSSPLCRKAPTKSGAYRARF
jgi:hypothetical protein